MKFAPTVRGVHSSPSHFGRYPNPPSDKVRITLPEIMAALEQQTDGMVKTSNFRPPGCENARCSFHGNFILMPDGSLTALTKFVPADTESCKDAGTAQDLRKSASCCSPTEIISRNDISGLPAEKAEDGARQAISTVARQWAFPVVSEKQCACSTDDLDAFLTRAKQYGFAISAMAFQDAWTLDMERLKDCCIHTVSPDGRLIPFCIYNLTSAGGETIYRRGQKFRI
ncbi:MAG: hypothetical protein R2941_14195 [Desulfobacterales bacterium]